MILRHVKQKCVLYIPVYTVNGSVYLYYIYYQVYITYNPTYVCIFIYV